MADERTRLFCETRESLLCLFYIGLSFLRRTACDVGCSLRGIAGGLRSLFCRFLGTTQNTLSLLLRIRKGVRGKFLALLEKGLEGIL